MSYSAIEKNATRLIVGAIVALMFVITLAAPVSAMSTQTSRETIRAIGHSQVIAANEVRGCRHWDKRHRRCLDNWYRRYYRGGHGRRH